MLFIHPMWDSENQRLGLKACTPLGYAIRAAADLVGFIGLSLFIAVPFYIHFHSWRLGWLFCLPFAVAAIGRALYEISWMVAAKKRFRYDGETRTARWIDGESEQIFPKRQ